MADEQDLDSANILRISRRYEARAVQSRRQRSYQNEANWQAYRGEQDFSQKAEYQSRETTPAFPLAVDQIVGTFERSLTDSDDWLSVDQAGIGDPFLTADQVKKLIMFYMERLDTPGNQPEKARGIQVVVGDASKVGIIEPVVTLKIYPVIRRRRIYKMERIEPDREDGDFPAYHFVGKKMKPTSVETMRLAIDVIPWEDYFPDPSEKGRWEIHRTRVSLDELLANEEYDQDVVRSLINTTNTTIADSTNERRGKSEDSVETDPYEIELLEGWGDIIDERTGVVLHENVFWAWAGDKLVRKPTPNPFWDGTSPFISAPLIRIPGSKEPRALADIAVPLWRAANELANLILDGSMRATWGVGQIRQDIIEHPEDVADGVPQGYTFVLKPNAPFGQKAYERVDNGEVPALALEGLQRMEQYVNEALAIPETRLGQTPDPNQTATATVQALRSSGSLYESFAARFEDTILEPLFDKAWKLIAQYADDFMSEEMVSVLGPTTVLRLFQMSQDERFKFIHNANFKVRGLRGLANREREFQKLSTLLSLLASNEQFADFYGRTRDYDRLFSALERSIGIDPEMFALPEPPPEVAGGAGELIPPEEPAFAGGQLDETLGQSSGASQPNISGGPGLQGEASALAPNNPGALGGSTSIV
jgi:hypothetical protein